MRFATALMAVMAVAWLGPAHDLRAQDLRVVALVNESTIGTEDRLTYTVEIQGSSLPEVETPQPPKTSGLALSSPFPSTSRNIAVVNGEMTVSLGFSWAFSPVGEGEAVIEPMTITAGGKQYETERVRVKVVPQSQRPARRRSNSLFDQLAGPTDEPQTEISDRDIFIRAAPSKRTAFQNEQITIEYGLYFRNGIQLRQSRLADSWDAEGFWREELEVESRPVPRTVVENGLRYNMIVLKRVAVFPTRTGQLEIDPLKIESEASAAFGSRDPFFALRNRYQPVELSSPSVRITSRTYPANAPASFGGAVGRFQMDVSLDRTEIEVGESAQLKVVVSGSGNIATMEGPTVDLPGIFEAYDPHVESSVNRSGNTVRGSKTFTYVLIPRSNGTFEIPPLEFSFLNASTGKYETLRSDAHTITVTGDVATLSAAIATAGGLPVDDIPPIMSEVKRWRKAAQPVHRSRTVYAVALLPLLLLGAAFAYKRRETRIQSDQQFARKRRANPVAKRFLKEAESFRESGNAKAYYAALEHAVKGFVGDRLNVGEKGLTIGAFCTLLEGRGVHAATLGEIRSLLEECDHVRFAPISPDQQAMNTAHERATTLIEQLNQQLDDAS